MKNCVATSAQRVHPLPLRVKNHTTSHDSEKEFFNSAYMFVQKHTSASYGWLVNNFEKHRQSIYSGARLFLLGFIVISFLCVYAPYIGAFCMASWSGLCVRCALSLGLSILALLYENSWGKTYQMVLELFLMGMIGFYWLPTAPLLGVFFGLSAYVALKSIYPGGEDSIVFELFGLQISFMHCLLGVLICMAMPWIFA
jgi:hypothetical protein